MKTANRHNRPSRCIITLATILLFTLLVVPSAAAQATEIRYPCLNVLENEEIGSEIQFMRISDRFDGRVLKDFQSTSITLEPDQIYDIAICIHNAADPALGPDGIAHDVQLSLELPSELTPERPGEIFAELSATNTLPGTISNALSLEASAPLTISSESFFISRYTTQEDFHAEIALDFKTPESDDDKLQATSSIGDIGPGEDNMQFVFVSFATQATEAKTNPASTIFIGLGIGAAVICAITIVIYQITHPSDKRYRDR